MAAEVEDEIGYLVKRVQQAFRRRSDAALKPTGLSVSQYAVLRALADHPEASAAELSRLCFITRQSLQDLLAGLRAQELVRTAAGARAGRARALELTPAGARCLNAAHRAVLEVNDGMTRGMPETVRSHLAIGLRRCAENLERSEG